MLWYCKKQNIIATSTTKAKYIVVESCLAQSAMDEATIKGLRSSCKGDKHRVTTQVLLL